MQYIRPSASNHPSLRFTPPFVFCCFDYCVVLNCVKEMLKIERFIRNMVARSGWILSAARLTEVSKSGQKGESIGAFVSGGDEGIFVIRSILWLASFSSCQVADC